MHKVISLGMGAIILLSIAAQSSTEFPTFIRCTTNASQEKIVIGLNISENRALLNYQSPEPKDLVSVGIGKPFGFYSSSHVNIESRYSARDKEQIITISARSNNITRILRYGEFSLVLQNNENGTLSPKKLTYKAGTDAFPEDNIENTLENLPLTCMFEN